MLGFSPFVYLVIWSCISSLEKGTEGGRTGEDAQATFPLRCGWSCHGNFPGSFPVLVTRRNLRVLFQTWCLEFCNSLLWGMAEVLLRHPWLSVLQLTKQACKLSFRCCKVFLFSIFFPFFLYLFFWIMCDPMGGKHRALYRSRSTLLIYICSFQVAGQIPGWHFLSCSTSVWGLHWQNHLAGAKSSCIS